MGSKSLSTRDISAKEFPESERAAMLSDFHDGSVLNSDGELREGDPFEAEGRLSAARIAVGGEENVPPDARQTPTIAVSPGELEMLLKPMISSYMAALGRQKAWLTHEALAAIVAKTCHLFASSCGSAIRDRSHGVLATRLEKVNRYIDQHLSDVELTPSAVATANGISLRQLHRLFEPTGKSFMQHVIARRLEECHEILISPAGAGRSIAEIAFSSGFSSLPSFYRGFSRRYAVSPRELRASTSLPARCAQSNVNRPGMARR